MSVIFSDPTTLTVEALKKQLQIHGVSLPASNSKKDIYIELYKRHVLSQPSTDRGPCKIEEKNEPLNTTRNTKMDITSLSDEELTTMLTERGFVPGPIVDSTRRVYEKKLQRMLETDVHAEGSYIASFDHEEYSEADDDDDDDDANADTQPIAEEMQSYGIETRSSPARGQHQHTYSYRQETIASSGGDSSQLTRRALRQTNMNDFVTQATPPPEETKKGGLSLCTQLVIFLVVALVIFLVIQNMEPAAKDPLAGVDAN